MRKVRLSHDNHMTYCMPYVYIGAYIFKAYTNGHPYDTSQVNQTDTQSYVSVQYNFEVHLYVLNCSLDLGFIFVNVYNKYELVAYSQCNFEH